MTFAPSTRYGQHSAPERPSGVWWSPTSVTRLPRAAFSCPRGPKATRARAMPTGPLVDPGWRRIEADSSYLPAAVSSAERAEATFTQGDVQWSCSDGIETSVADDNRAFEANPTQRRGSKAERTVGPWG